MYKAEAQAVNGGNLPADGSSVKFDLSIGHQWVNLAYLKIVALSAGAMEITFEIWETATYVPTRAEMYQRVFRRDYTLAAADGAEIGEFIEPYALPYWDRDGEFDDYNIHCRLVNKAGGTASDFDVSITVQETGIGV